MSVTAEVLKEAWQRDPDAVARAFGNMLREFGFKSLTDADIKRHISQFYAGEPEQADVIGKMIRQYLEKGT
jgi:hypothetical protein